ncbi:MAG: hypothetical protein C5B46_02260 [Proteobacteria bacterium]|nr:MAG: hypothetical protein C5B46_02260 [Pseudomonadota bacterium]
MPQLTFEIDGAAAVPYAAVPTIGFKLRIGNHDDSQINGVTLQCQVRIESTRRRYGQDERHRLFDLFGEPHRWSQTLRSMLWTQVNANVSSFSDETTVDLLVPCSFDFNVAATKYFGSLTDGNVPLSFLFSGTVFYSPAAGHLQIQQIPWDNEAKFQLPVVIWKEMMEKYYPNEKWLAIRGDIFDRLVEYKRRRALPTWDQALESLLSTANHIDDRPLMANKPS